MIRNQRAEMRKSATHKVCRECGINLCLSEYHRSQRGLYGRKERCKSCTRKRRTTAERRRRQLRSKYGLMLADYERLYLRQGGRCAICGSRESHGKTEQFTVDHDHKTGKVRALLCNKCNPALGLMDDDPERLEKAAQYIRTHRV